MASAALRILLVDDDPDDRRLAARALRQAMAGLELVEVGDLAGLESALTVGGFDGVITDFALQWSDGLAVLRAVRERLPRCPVIMFTGRDDKDFAAEAIRAGISHYLVKSPLEYARLPLTVRAAVEMSRRFRG